MKRMILFAFFAMLLWYEIAAADCLVPYAGGSVSIAPATVGEETCYFLPAFADGQIIVDGTAVSLAELPYDEGRQGYRYQPEGSEVPMLLMRGSLPALFLYSDDPEQYGRAFVEGCEHHENEAEGSLVLCDTDGYLLCAEELSQIRGRGNSTWSINPDKAPYQIKLKHKHNLLNPDDDKQAAKKWVLLAEFFDNTLLNNRISLNLALELGLGETPESESVDLYYDGEYRGVYTLCEKVEVHKGRMELPTESAAQTEPLVPMSGVNALGLEIHYYDGVTEPEDPSQISYVTEMEATTTLDESSCWFRLGNDYIMSLKEPEYVSYESMCYISERMETLWQAVSAGDDTCEPLLDTDSFARALLVYDYTYCKDGLAYSSGYFKLPAGSSCWQAGPVWDFDLSLRYFTAGGNAGGFGMHREERKEWFSALCAVPCIQRRMTELWQQEMRPMAESILLGSGEGRYLRSLSAYEAEIASSEAMNAKLYPLRQTAETVYGRTIQESHALQRQFLTDRVRWMDASLGHMFQNEADTVCLNATTCYTDPEYSFQLTVKPCFYAEVGDIVLTQLTEADESHYAQWQVDALLTPQEGCRFTAEPRVYVNGIALPVTATDDGGLALCFTFADETYKPLDIDGMDYGLVLDLDRLRGRADLGLTEATDDEIIDYFFNIAMPDGQAGNAYFYPRLIRNECAELGLDGEFIYDYQNYMDWGQYEWDLTAYEEALMLRYAVKVRKAE